MKIISLVGKRSIPVVLPIYTLLKRNLVSTNEFIEIDLIYSSETKDLAFDCKKWLEEELNNDWSFLIEPKEFKKDKEFLQSLTRGQKVYFNVNPGPNYQVSFCVLTLPEDTMYMATDSYWFYVWPPNASVEKHLLLDIGLDNFNRLSDIKAIKTGEEFRIEGTENDSLASD
ncbi:hypothetical protein KJ693_07690 [bacterium]|nr:hypothetical protein [bacterium]MBU1615180.1 hypothetical protein [bacterium]